MPLPRRVPSPLFSAPPSAVALLAVVAMAAAVACAAEERTIPRAADLPPPSAVGSGSVGRGRDGGASEAGADGGSCLDGEVDVVVDTRLGGSLELGGTVRFPVTVEAGRLVVIQIVEADTGRLSEARGVLPARAAELRYRGTGLPAGTYLVRTQIDQTGSSQVGEAGDLDGYYDGAEASPIVDPTLARPVVLDGACQDGLDYGVGVRF